MIINFKKNTIETIIPFELSNDNLRGIKLLNNLEQLDEFIIINYSKQPLYTKFNDCYNNCLRYQNRYGGNIIGGYYFLSDFNNINNFVAIKHFVINKNDKIIDVTPNSYYNSLSFKISNNLNIIKSPDKYEYFNQELIHYHYTISNP